MKTESIFSLWMNKQRNGLVAFYLLSHSPGCCVKIQFNVLILSHIPNSYQTPELSKTYFILTPNRQLFFKKNVQKLIQVIIDTTICCNQILPYKKAKKPPKPPNHYNLPIITTHLSLTIRINHLWVMLSNVLWYVLAWPN